jgi:hypothetical protein
MDLVSTLLRSAWAGNGKAARGLAQNIPSGQRFRCMTSRAEAAKTAVQVGKKQILDQQLRIGRHRELMAKLERDGQPDLLAQARRQLVEMEQTLAQMEAAYAGGPAGRRLL